LTLSGSVLRITDNVIPAKGPTVTQDDEEDDEYERTTEDTKAVEELGTFDEVVVGNHDMPWDAAEDPYVKGIDEWMHFANAVSVESILIFVVVH
jgi:ribonuclease H2 subunit C